MMYNSTVVAVLHSAHYSSVKGKKMSGKTMSLRIDDEQARALEAAAMAGETTVSEIVRDAISERIEKLRNDAEFQARLKRALERNREALELLSK